jgi:hypothetical protein
MQTATIKVKTGPFSSKNLRDVTPAEAVVLAKLHHVATGGTAIGSIVITGTAQERAGYHFEEVVLSDKSKDRKKVYDYRDRTDAEERARLEKRFTGNIGSGRDVKPAFLAVFPDDMQPLPTTFKSIARHLGSEAKITTQEEIAEEEAVREEVKARLAKAKDEPVVVTPDADEPKTAKERKAAKEAAKE